MVLLNEARRILGESIDGYGSGWWNINTGQRFQQPNVAHAEVILDNAVAFGVQHLISATVWDNPDEMERIASKLDGHYETFYDKGWLRYLWAQEHGERLLAGSSNSEVLVEAWDKEVIHDLYDEFNPTFSYWYSSEHGGSPKSQAIRGIPPSIEDWFLSLSGEDEINDIRRRAGIS